jgi:LacI family transcriptional regulator
MGELTKYLDVAKMIEAEIVSGLWSEGVRMPGVRGIASKYGVSTVTASRSLQVLRDRGLIHSVERSGSFPVANKAVDRRQRVWSACFRTTPGPWYGASHSTTMSGFAAMAHAGEIGLDTVTFRIEDSSTEAQIVRMARDARALGVTGLFLMPSRISEAAMRQDEAILRGCRSSNLPVVLIERNLRGVGRPLEYDVVGPDDLDGGYQCARHLHDSGRRRVAFVPGSPTSSHRDRLAGYLLARQEVGEAPILIDLEGDPLDRLVCARLADRVIASEVDGVTCYHDVVAMGLIIELLARRVRIPEDVAVVGFEDLPIGDAFSIGLTTYGPNFEAIARRALRVMTARIDAPDAPPARIVVPGRVIVRESAPTRSPSRVSSKTAGQPGCDPPEAAPKRQASEPNGSD